MAWSSVLWSSPGINAHNLNHFPLLPAASSPTHSPYSTKIKTLLACKHTHYCRSLLRDFGPCKAKNREGFNEELQVQEDGDPVRRIALQAALWSAEAAYILWLFLLPYAPGDPVWSIKPETINDLLGLSLNFFFVVPILNSAGIHMIEEPVLHPVAEGLFNFVIGWTFMFAPLLFTDRRRDRYKGSLDVLWSLQMFLTNTFLIPYMAIRLNDIDVEQPPLKASRLGSLMTRGASVVGLIGAAVCVTSALWALFGRIDGGFGGIADRWQFCQMYITSERLAYAFIWDICLYSIFQPWLIGGNLQNVRKSNEGLVGNLRFVPVLGLVAYLFCLDVDSEL
ncbi:uncharacterized protein LOC120281662 [Dioscorea cayenensis subsp. rotundata]|uniref:Uncharacterized protein LOC120281662 n=1 Tax=Dioscorea cayennensis subsp. rotundata TaxID=55577 RepID=A0AB40D0F6_DIOCR|nr:uncharacterized protein LOC120281662 [Dioscorea cayenensis subsp. rotundata]